jgi:dTMP kinase
MTSQGLLFTFEGIDGCGKSTQLTLLAEFLKSKNIPHESFREPGGNVVSESIRDLLLHTDHPITPSAEVFLFSAARAQLIEQEIKPRLEKGITILLDRFFDSTTAYQGYGHGMMDPTTLQRLHPIATGGLLPHRTYIFDLSVEQARSRTKQQEKDRIEQQSVGYFERVAEGYRQIATTASRYMLLDASWPIGQLHEAIREDAASWIHASQGD